MNINVIRNIRNHRFLISCFKILVSDNDFIGNHYKLKIASNGVMYTVVSIDKDIPQQYKELAILNKLALLDEAMNMMNMAGLFTVAISIVDGAVDQTKEFYLVKFIPSISLIFNYTLLVIMISSLIAALFLLYRYI